VAPANTSIDRVCPVQVDRSKACWLWGSGGRLAVLLFEDGGRSVTERRGNPVADRPNRRLGLASPLFGRAAGANKLDGSAPELRRIGGRVSGIGVPHARASSASGHPGQARSIVWGRVHDVGPPRSARVGDATLTSWPVLDAGEFATQECLDWVNTRRLREPIGHVPSASAEKASYAARCPDEAKPALNATRSMVRSSGRCDRRAPQSDRRHAAATFTPHRAPAPRLAT
jgi:hypothetical protein